MNKIEKPLLDAFAWCFETLFLLPLVTKRWSKALNKVSTCCDFIIFATMEIASGLWWRHRQKRDPLSIQNNLFWNVPAFQVPNFLHKDGLYRWKLMMMLKSQWCHNLDDAIVTWGILKDLLCIGDDKYRPAPWSIKQCSPIQKLTRAVAAMVAMDELWL